MSSTVSTVLKIVLTLAIIGLGYWLYAIIQKPIQYEDLKAERYEKIKERLEKIRDVQKVFRAEYNAFAPDFNTLIAFADTGKETILERKDSSFVFYDEVFQQERSKDTVVVKVLGYRNVGESLFGKNFDVSQLQYIPGTKDKFEMDASKIKVGDVIIPVFEAKAPNTVVFGDVQKKYDQFIDKNYELKVGSMTEPTLSGNWK